MVQLFVSDIDGCLSLPFRSFRLDRIAALRQMISRSQQSSDGQADQSRGPAFSLCSGRSYAYVEAMTQVLGIDQPVLFESAGGMIFPDSMRFEWHPEFSETVDKQVSAIRDWYSGMLDGTDLWIDAAKRTQAGIAGRESAIKDLIRRTRQIVESEYPDMLFTHTPVSVDIVPSVLTKEAGMLWLSTYTGIPLENMAYIGDANGDIGALRCVGHSFAPANAAEEVKDAAGTVTKGSDIDGVIEAYQLVSGH